MDPFILAYVIACGAAAIIMALLIADKKRTCRYGGCGHQVPSSDDRCAVCRLPLDTK